MATALLKFSQGINIGLDGEALVVTTGAPVAIENSNNTGVDSWVIILLEAPPDSVTYPPASNPQVLAQAATNTPLANITPDVEGSYRILLDVLEGADRDRDIRNVGVPDAYGVIRPPWQADPPPLPITPDPVIPVFDDPDPKPNEQNYGGQTGGWMGRGPADGQMDHFIRVVRDIRSVVPAATPINLTDRTPELVLVNGALLGPSVVNLPATARIGQSFKIAETSGTVNPITINTPGGHTIIQVGGPSFVLGNGFDKARLTYLGSNQWALVDYDFTLGAALPSVIPIFHAYAETDLLGFQRLSNFVFAAPSTGTIEMVSVIEVTSANVGCEIRLFNLTDGVVVGPSVQSTTGITPTIETATLTAGPDLPLTDKLYEFQFRMLDFGALPTDRAICTDSTLVFTP